MASIKQGTALALLLGALAGAGGGCGESSEGGAEEPSRPERIVSLSPSATETLFAVGAGPQVVAVDGESDYPPGTPRTELEPYQPNVEAIAGFRPDLVVLPADAPQDAIDGLRRLRLEVLADPAPDDLEEAYAGIVRVGEAAGHRPAAERLARQVRERVDGLLAAAPDGRGRTVFHELDPDLYSPSSETFIGRIYARLGLRNVADAAAKRSGAEYPQLSSEAVVRADPDLILLADTECCQQTPARVARRPGWHVVSAIRSDAVVAVDQDVAARWGPRIPEFVDTVVRAMEAAR